MADQAMNRSYLSRKLRKLRLSFPVNLDEQTLADIYHLVVRASLPTTEQERQNIARYEYRTPSVLKKLSEISGVPIPDGRNPEDFQTFLHRLLDRKEPLWEKRIAYWQEAVSHGNLSELGNSEKIPVRFAFTERQGSTAPRPTTPIASSDLQDHGAVGWWMIFGTEAGHGSNFPLNVLLAVPLASNGEGTEFIPPKDANPRLHRDWMEPANPYAPKNRYLCTVQEYEQWSRDHELNDEDRDQLTWPVYWNRVEKLVADLTGGPLERIHHAAGEDQKPLIWQVVKDPVNANWIFLEALSAAITGEAPLLRQSVERHVPEPLRSDLNLLGARHHHLAHMDTYHPESKQRGGFALEKSQRQAVQHMQLVPDHRLLAVNGPPGTGKTSFLRAVIASLWVQSALDGKDSALILATAATNKAVTNIIESFAEVSGPELQPDWASRWLPNLPSYGWFHPAKSRSSEQWKGYMALRDHKEKKSLVMDGTASDFYAEAITGTDAMKETYLRLHAQCTGRRQPLATITDAAADIHVRLHKSVQEMHSIQRNVANLIQLRGEIDPVFRNEAKVLQQSSALQEQINGMQDLCKTFEQKIVQKKRERQQLLSTWETYRADKVGAEREKRAKEAAAIVEKIFSDLVVPGASRNFWGWFRILRNRKTQKAYQDRVQAAELAIQQVWNRPIPEPEPPQDLHPIDGAIQEYQNKVAGYVSTIQSLKAKATGLQEYLQPLARFRQDLAAILNGLMTLNSNIPERVILSLRGLDSVVPVTSFEEIIPQIEEWLDLTYRFQHFHLAARYWEARWLATPLQIENANKNHLQHLRHLAMLAPVIVATVHTTQRVRGNADFSFADLLVFDEAGQAIPEMGCAAFALARRAIVVGDVYQLEPIWRLTEPDEKLLLDRVGLNENMHEEAGEDGPAIDPALSATCGSVMMVAQRVSYFGPAVPEQGHPAGVNLTAHYRCRKDIINYCRELIYGDELCPLRKEAEADSYLYPAMSWVAVDGPPAVKDNKSWRNDAQVEEIVGWLADESDRMKNHYGKADLAEIVAIIAPFAAQARALKKAVERHPTLGPKLATRMIINTVHALQGAEIPVVAFSLTQDAPPYFVDGTNGMKPNLLNVAVSRAKDAFVLFATPAAIQPKGDKTDTKKPFDLMVDYLQRVGQRLYPRELVFIESPQKAEHITQALGRTAKILATGGHFQEVSEWPKGQPPQWKDNGGPFLHELSTALQVAGQLDHFILATDDDRDGEEIAWHILQRLRQVSPRLLDRTVRMRFADLSPGTIRRARKQALPGVDLRRVQASLIKRLADYRLQERITTETGLHIGRNQIATLRWIQQASHPEEMRYRVVVRGTVRDIPVRAYVVANESSTAPAAWMLASKAWETRAQLGSPTSIPIWKSVHVDRRYPSFPANTTDRMFLSGWRRYHWKPQETAMHLQNLYWGRFNTEICNGGGS